MVDRIAEGEGQSTEFKADFPESARDLAKEIAGFATSNEGHVILGVDDEGDVVGLGRSENLTEPAWKDEIQKRVQGTAGIVSPRIRVETRFAEIHGKTVCDVFVPEGEEPVYYVGGIPYLRDLTVTRRAEPEEVKEFHRKDFAKRVAAPTLGQGALIELLNQLADADLILSDLDKRHGDDIDQWRYDLEATSEILRKLSATSSVDAVGAHDEIVNLAAALLEMRDFRLYINGGVSWKQLLKKSEDARSQARRLAGRVMKRLSLSDSQLAELVHTAALNVRLLKDEWRDLQASDKLGRLSLFRSEIRRLAFLFSHVSFLFQVAGKIGPAEVAAEVASLLHSVDREQIFRPGIGRSPIDVMRDSMERTMVLGDALTKQVENLG